MRRIGFSTGALARGDFRAALATLRHHGVRVVELSALRVEELDPLVNALPSLDLSDFDFVSIHAPSRYEPEEETRIIGCLQALADRGYPVVVHPDVIFDRPRWRVFGEVLFIENMDKRKAVGRTVDELREFFADLPAARFCFDIGHARQVDPSMTEAALLLGAFQDRLGEIHMSEVNSGSRHDPISNNAVSAFSSVLSSIPEAVPIVLEPLIDHGQSDVETELRRAHEVFAVTTVA
jgi:hypothetical protein